ncbi:MAG TPA: glycosyltransferase family 1 protein [Candidatus Polarisedimenticolia bacterium]|nr:glycosyltransferase family 1 protein [Candidatus Polarisedimenticolia bacterium]
MTARAQDALTVGIDARPMAGQPTGVGRYVANLAREMARIDPGVRLRLYAPSPPAEPAPPGTRLEILALPGGPFGGLDNAFVWNHARLPIHLAMRRVDLYHGTFYTLPAICPCPAVVTLHDITFELHPEWFTPRARLALGGFAASSARKARHVLTVSERSRKDIIERYGLPDARVTSAPLAPDPRLRRVEDPARIAAVRDRHGAGEEYVLHVGSITPRRNIDRLLDAFAVVRRRAPHLRLLLAGRVEPPSPPLEPAIQRRGLAGAVLAAGYVPPEDLPALYSGAAAVACPSLYEGFGLPVLEAMACGTPVLASSTSCFPEVAGDAALLVDPLDTEAIAAGLWTVVADPSARSLLVERGLRRASEFTWERTARRTLEVYRMAAQDAAPAGAGRGGRG